MIDLALGALLILNIILLFINTFIYCANKKLEKKGEHKQIGVVSNLLCNKCEQSLGKDIKITWGRDE